MQFNEVRKELEGVVFDMLRIDSDNYFEVVIVRNELAKLTARLERLFGSPLQPCDKRLSLQVQEMIKEFGGIRPYQSLYFWKEEKYAVFAMLWPWQDGCHTTVKIIQK